ncbi:hypothetical protein B0H13DRAFT_385133 [Mycena leptocephala]|nr:hypothetical protein B0H13DRAFT_385133 [Mycena leptocephala]
MSQSSPSNPPLEYFTRRRRVYVACVHCRQRKIRCITSEESRDKPCERCAKKGLQCEYLAVSEQQANPPQTPSARNTRSSNPQQTTPSTSSTWNQPYDGYGAESRSPNQRSSTLSNSFHPHPLHTGHNARSLSHLFPPTQHQSDPASRAPNSDPAISDPRTSYADLSVYLTKLRRPKPVYTSIGAKKCVISPQHTLCLSTRPVLLWSKKMNSYRVIECCVRQHDRELFYIYCVLVLLSIVSPA